MKLRRAEDLRPGVLYRATVLRKQGMHPRVLASSALIRPLPELLARADGPPSLHVLASAVQSTVAVGAVISHETAAELLGFPLPRKLTRAGGARLHCRREQRGTGYSSARLVVHTGRTAATIRFRGLRLSSPVSALLEVAPQLGHGDLVACIDALVGGKCHVPAVSLDELRGASASWRGPQGRALRRALADARDRVWSPMETRLRLLLLAQGFPEPEPNVEVRDPATNQRFYLDLAYPQWCIAIEYDSEEHRTDRAQWQKDLHKNEVLHHLGWTVLRVSVADVRSPSALRRRLAAAIVVAVDKEAAKAL